MCSACSASPEAEKLAGGDEGASTETAHDGNGEPGFIGKESPPSLRLRWRRPIDMTLDT